MLPFPAPAAGCCWATVLVLFCFGPPAKLAQAYVPNDPWTVTASGPVAGEGTPAVLTWSLAPDDTTIPGATDSGLIGYLDGLLNVVDAGADYTQRPWFSILESSFARWSELGGVEFVYEPADDGDSLLYSSGILGVRGDVRIGGASVDGPLGTLAYAWSPDYGDVVIDTDETGYFRTTSHNYRNLRNTLMHELGHALGLDHVTSSNEALLMEPVLNSSIDGPQLDEVVGLHGLYGDAREKSNGGLGNDSAALASDLGTLSLTTPLRIGAAAAVPSQAIDLAATDFVSVTNDADVDYFSFTVYSPGLLSATLTPRGGVFSQGAVGQPESIIDANARNDLSLTLLAADGVTSLVSSNAAGLGGTEQFSALSLDQPGEYYVRIAGSMDAVQLYELELSLSSGLHVLAGDLDLSGSVDGRDALAWLRNFGSTGFDVAADANGDGIVDADDLAAWEQNFGAGQSPLTPQTVPEPSAGMLCCLAAMVAGCVVRPRRQ